MKVIFIDNSQLHTFKYYSGLGGRNDDRKILPHFVQPIYTLSSTNSSTNTNEIMPEPTGLYTVKFGKLMFHSVSEAISKKRYNMKQINQMLYNKEIKSEFTSNINFNQETYLKELLMKFNFEEQVTKHIVNVYIENTKSGLKYKTKFTISDSGI